MTPREFRVAVLQDFKTYWDASGPTPAVQVAYDNIDIKPDGAEWIQFTVGHGSGTIAALGQKFFRRTGLIVANIYVREGQGQQRIDEIAEALLAWIERFEVGGGRVRDPGYIELGSVGGWWQANVSATFEYDALRV